MSVEQEHKTWHVYMIRTIGGKLYTGITTDVSRRFTQHATGKGAKFFHTDPPQQVVWQQICQDRSDALRQEAAIKKLGVNKKEALLREQK